MTDTLEKRPTGRTRAPRKQAPVATEVVPRTTLPRRELDTAAPAPEERRGNGWRISDVLALVGALAASLALTTVLFTQLAPLSGPIAFVVVEWIMFVLLYAVITAADQRGPIVVDRVVTVFVHSLAALVFLVLVFVVVFAFVRGWGAVTHLNFFTQDMRDAGPLDPLTQGGVIHAVVGTLIQIAIALAITIPLGLTTALFLTEVPGPFARFVRTIVEAMTALPSIVAGLFIYASFILVFGLQKSGFAASLAITVMMLPIMIRSSDVVLRLVPSTLKEASIGLGAGQWATVWRVVLPTSRSGLLTAIILATARGIGETSPVLLTSGYTSELNVNPFDGPMVSLPLAVFTFVKSPEPGMVARGFGTAAVLLVLVLVLFLTARIIGGRTMEKKERAFQRREAVRAAVVHQSLVAWRGSAIVREPVARASSAAYRAAAPVVAPVAQRAGTAVSSRVRPVAARVASSVSARMRRASSALVTVVRQLPDRIASRLTKDDD